MPRPSLRTRSRKRSRCPLPGGRSKIKYKSEKTAATKCSTCGRELPSLPHSAAKIRRLPRTGKKISRIYGGQLCHICLRESLKKASRSL
ncbi:MAG: 50S ribosomal protein L34e [Candidatus Bathyarchaeota archaeon]|nr:50S ribosomal protein L34e [Candidatus Bathyarchaeota archaeon]